MPVRPTVARPTVAVLTMATLAFGCAHQVRLATLPGFPAWEREAFDSFHTHFSKVKVK